MGCPSNLFRYRCVVVAASAVLLLVLLAGCRRAPATPPVDAPLLAPVATAATSLPDSQAGAATIAPVPTTTAPIAPSTTATATQILAGPAAGIVGEPFTSPRYDYTVALPCCWVALPAPATAVEAALSDLAAGTGDPLYDNLLDELREEDEPVTLEYLAYLPDASGLPDAQLTVSVMPAAQLTLDSYIDGVTAEIGGIGATAVVTGQIEPALGPEASPASVIEYTTVYDADPIYGLQIAFRTAGGDHLIVLTFTTDAERFGDLRGEFMEIARNVTFES